jgi:thiosulfate reductase cytochrome b subunit
MIWSGVLIYWANQAYIKIPAGAASALNIEYSLARGMGWHFLMMWPFALNGLGYVIYLFVSREWKMLVPLKNSFKEAILVILHDFKLRKSTPEIIGKFNAAQRIAYSGVILMGAGMLVTGLAIYKPVQAGLLTKLLGGYEAARFEHFLLTVGFILFIILHILQVMKAGWNNFRAMLAGYEIEKE